MGNKPSYSQTSARAILGVGITSQSSDDLISGATSKAQTKTERSNTSQKIEHMINQLEILSKARNATKKLARRIKNLRTRLMKENIQISIDKLRVREQIIPELVHKGDIIQGEVVIYLDDVGIKHLSLLVIPESHILLA
jgi:polyhydroxyalkanoate synthesis regulator phasin